jgi:hypothetical protein
MPDGVVDLGSRSRRSQVMLAALTAKPLFPRHSRVFRRRKPPTTRAEEREHHPGDREQSRGETASEGVALAARGALA